MRIRCKTSGESSTQAPRALLRRGAAREPVEKDLSERVETQMRKDECKRCEEEFPEVSKLLVAPRKQEVYTLFRWMKNEHLYRHVPMGFYRSDVRFPSLSRSQTKPNSTPPTFTVNKVGGSSMVFISANLFRPCWC